MAIASAMGMFNALLQQKVVLHHMAQHLPRKKKAISGNNINHKHQVTKHQSQTTPEVI